MTDEISIETFGITTKKHKSIKNLNKNQILRDNMSPLELALTTLAEVTTTEFHRTNDSQGMTELKVEAHDGGEVAAITRRNIEKRIGKPIVTSETAINFKEKINIETKYPL